MGARPKAPCSSIRRALVLVAIAALVLLAVLLPNTEIAWMRENWDWFNAPMLLIERVGGPISLIHFWLFLLLGVAMALAVPQLHAVAAGASILLFGTLTELLQVFVPGRQARISDVAVDLGAGLLGWLCTRWIVSARNRHDI